MYRIFRVKTKFIGGLCRNMFLKHNFMIFYDSYIRKLIIYLANRYGFRKLPSKIKCVDIVKIAPKYQFRSYHIFVAITDL